MSSKSYSYSCSCSVPRAIEHLDVVTSITTLKRALERLEAARQRKDDGEPR